MTPMQIIAQVLDNLERPDLESLAISRFRPALRAAHNVEIFRRDLVSESFLLSDYVVLDGKVTLDVPERFRKLIRVYTTNAAGVVDKEFKDLGSKIEYKTYFGFQIQQTYNIFGSSLNVNGISTDATHAVLEFARFPSFEQDESDEWVTDSWIAIEAPEVIEAYLQHQLAMMTEDAQQISNAEKMVQMSRRDLIAAYVEEIV